MEKKAEEGPNVRTIEFLPGVEQITLHTPRDTWEQDGWSLCPLSSSSLKVRESLLGNEGMSYPNSLIFFNH